MVSTHAAAAAIRGADYVAFAKAQLYGGQKAGSMFDAELCSGGCIKWAFYGPDMICASI